MTAFWICLAVVWGMYKVYGIWYVICDIWYVDRNQTGAVAEIHVELLPAAVASGISHRTLFGSPAHDIALLF